MAQRLNTAQYPVKLIVPTDGMRHNTRPGEALYDSESDQALINTLKENFNSNINMIEIQGNLDTAEWGKQAAKEMLEVLGNSIIVTA